MLSAPPEDVNAIAAQATLAPGEAIDDWPVVLTLEERCGSRDGGIESGTYQMQVLYRLSEPERRSVRSVLSTEKLSVEIR